MKEQVDKALEHEVDVLGKTVPTLVVAVSTLFLVGASSAAVLNNFGTVAGDADVEQAVQLATTDGNDEETITAFEDSTNIVGQATSETQTFRLDVNTDQELDVSFDLSDTEAQSFYDTGTNVGFLVEVDEGSSGSYETSLALGDGSDSVQLGSGEHTVRTTVDFPLNYDVTAGDGSTEGVSFDVVIDAEAAN